MEEPDTDFLDLLKRNIALTQKVADQVHVINSTVTGQTESITSLRRDMARVDDTLKELYNKHSVLSELFAKHDGGSEGMAAILKMFEEYLSMNNEILDKIQDTLTAKAATRSKADSDAAAEVKRLLDAHINEEKEVVAERKRRVLDVAFDVVKWVIIAILGVICISVWYTMHNQPSIIAPTKGPDATAPAPSKP